MGLHGSLLHQTVQISLIFFNVKTVYSYLINADTFKLCYYQLSIRWVLRVITITGQLLADTLHIPPVLL